MNKKTIERIISAVPLSLKNMVGYIKDNFDDSGQEALTNATGTVGIIVKIFAQSKIDKYFDNLTKNKLEDFGSNMYLKASLIQVGKSLEILEEDEELENDALSVVSLLESALNTYDSLFTKDNVLTIFTPQYHPIIVDVKNRLKNILFMLNLEDSSIKKFTKNFNDNIEETIITTFGSNDYEKHKKEINNFLLNENESKLLCDMYQLRKIGFKDNESLKYEKTFASWKPISNYADKEKEKVADKEHKSIEDSLITAETLINNYFDLQDKDTLGNILFLVADFGKGKSVFLKQYASKLAKEYTETSEGLFPIYFNLRNFSTYSSQGELGILSDYLLEKYQIRITDEHFKQKRYIFLIDSLDECGVLVESHIKEVLTSIKNIQLLDKEKCINNRIVVTSRPFSDGLENQLKTYKPYTIKDNRDKDIPQFISIYGFKEEQFNSWLYSALRNYGKLKELKTTGFAKEIIDNILNNKEPLNIYEKLLSEKTLSRTELRRPIFAYMIFQLIINNVDFSKIGKIGIYLSFINLLTKDAKHTSDKSYVVKLQEEIRYRNILHSISALWMHGLQEGKQGVLSKADICRTIEGKNIDSSDKTVLDTYKESGVTEIKFLSHSYFGENDNMLHFQHQSFAEILLAEYYLKIFIKFALDKKYDIDKVRAKLILGKPTEQTILFFKELLKLLKETVSEDKTDIAVLEKRKLLLPLFASLATETNNTLYSDDLFYDWFRDAKITKESSYYTDDLIINWAMTQEKLNKVIDLASEVIDEKTSMLLAKSEQKSSLFANELTIFSNRYTSEFPTDIDKWLSLILGNILYTDIDKNRFFNQNIINTNNFFEMIKNWNYSNNESAPTWAQQAFIGIKMKQNIDIHLSNISIGNINFSYSELKNLYMTPYNTFGAIFDYCIFDNVSMISSDLRKTSFNDVTIINGFDIAFSTLEQYLFIPPRLAEILRKLNTDTPESGTYVNYGDENILISYDADVANRIFNTLKGLFIVCLKEGELRISDIKSFFKYKDHSIKEKLESFIDALQEFETELDIPLNENNQEQLEQQL